MGSCASVHKSSSSVLKLEMVPNDNSSIPSTPIKHNHIHNNNHNDNDKPKSSPIVDPPVVSVGYKSQVSPFNSISSYRSHGSKEETFYDTQAWLDSDCDDDFYSVTGDFSSRGSTPGHDVVTSSRYIRTFSPQVNRALFDGRPPLRSASNQSTGSTPLQRSSSGASPRVSVTGETGLKQNTNTSSTTKRKKLAELFRESIRERADEELTFAGYAKSLSPNVHDLQHTSSTNSASSAGSRNSTGNYVLRKVKPLSKVVQCGCFPRLVSSRIVRERNKASSPYQEYGSSKSV